MLRKHLFLHKRRASSILFFIQSSIPSIILVSTWFSIRSSIWLAVLFGNQLATLMRTLFLIIGIMVYQRKPHWFWGDLFIEPSVRQRAGTYRARRFARVADEVHIVLTSCIRC